MSDELYVVAIQMEFENPPPEREEVFAVYEVFRGEKKEAERICRGMWMSGACSYEGRSLKACRPKMGTAKSWDDFLSDNA
jgi:hypothetical protein